MNQTTIVIFVYNRVSHTKRLIESLLLNQEASSSDVVFFSDGAKVNDFEKVRQVRDYIKSLTGFKSITIVEREENYGLAQNIITGISSLFIQFDKLIILEDDLVLSPYFLRFMNDALNLYEVDENVGSIHGYVYPVKTNLPETFFLRGADCWGWATWKRAWKLFEADGKLLLEQLNKQKLKKEFDYGNSYPFYNMLKKQVEGKNNSWAVRWHASLFLKNMLTLYPGVSFVTNQGGDASGTHLKTTNVFNTRLAVSYQTIERIPSVESPLAKVAFKDFFFSIHKNPIKRMLRRWFK